MAGVIFNPLNPTSSAEGHAKVQFPAIPHPTENLREIVACLEALKQNVEMMTKQHGQPENYMLTVCDLVELGILEEWVLEWLRKP